MSDIATIDNEPLMKPEVFVDLDIDDDADFDTIYEFLENFEDIVNSGNDYSTDMSSTYMGDIEMIQVALKFLGHSGINTDGRYTQNTERSVRDFQADNGLS
jgi:peptidoglycan hydrolase-like protein with peptidoglycan-binding domain